MRLPARAEAAPCAASALALAALLLWGPPEARFPAERSVAVYDRRGELLGASVSPGGFWRFPEGAELPAKYVEALVAFEDKRFFSHVGFDPAALVRAALQNRRAGRVVSGGSTITMQVARLARPGRPRDIPEKAAEAWLALRLELLRGKRGILALYAENAPFGGNVVGLEAASFRYFGRSPGLLSWAEAATLAVLPNAPSAAHPGRNRERLLAKRDALLWRLRGRGSLGEGELALALAEPLPPEPYDLPSLGPQLVDRARAAALRGSGPFRAETTIDAALQERVASILARRVARLAAGGVYNAACVVARVDTGEVLAYVANASPPPATGGGAAGYASRGYAMDLIRASRSSGSLFKPFLYAAALDSGELGPRSLLPDLPTRYGSYGPENASGGYSGAVRADEALARSLNVPFVRLLRDYGVSRFHALLASTGMGSLGRPAEDYGLALILGGAETSLWDMAGRYAALARSAAGLYPRAAGRRGGGQQFDLGLSLPELRARALRPDPFSPGAAALALEAMSALARPEEEAAWELYASSRRVSWKTGTSYGFRDAWAVGVNAVEAGSGRLGDACVVGVWAGNADGTGRPGLKGSAAAAPILFEVFGLLGSAGIAPPSAEPPQAGPAGPAFRSVEVCADSGWAAGPHCPRVESVRAPAGARSLRSCPYCRSVALSDDGAYRVSALEEGAGEFRIEKRFVLPPAIESYYRRSHLEYRPLPPPRPGTAAGRAEESLAILVPEQGAALYIPVEITGRPGALVMSAAHRDSGALVHWHLDGTYLGSTRGEHRLEIRPAKGRHVLTLVDEEGREASRSFEVLSQGLRP
ncbi:MAG TPA: penicillin-binding protein 1C [Spirochaetia bacterium]|nr:penicillin-binding protein 1C [Spirochaetia bacterium]HRZ63520.1 penicillin-binding protein 1C [Spirochaetia bacterium]